MSDLYIHRAEMDRLEEMVAVWCAAFPGDPQEYVNDFLSELPNDAIALIGESDNHIATMLFLLPAQARFRDISYPVRYLYAGCTHPQYRGLGYYRQLMVAAAQIVETLGEHAIYLHPADEVLTQTYKRLGYYPGIYRDSRVSTCQYSHVCHTVDEYMQQRERIGDRMAYDTVVWQPTDGVTRRFVADAVAIGAEMTTGAEAVQLTYKGRALETLHINAVCENEDYCLWLPIGDTPLVTLMNEFNGFTGLVGD